MPSLRTLKLSSNPVKDRGLLALAQSAWPSLEHLDVSACELQRAGIIGLAESPLVKQLTSLQLSGNSDVTPDAWVVLGGAPMERLHQLDLNNGAVTDEVAVALAANPALAGLRVLDLGGATITDRGARAILDSLLLKNLKRLRLPTRGVQLDTLLRLRATFGDGFNPQYM
jgi:hypothetical protein